MSRGEVRWGFIGAGFIASAALAPAVHAAAGATLQAVAAGDPARARRLEPTRVHNTYRDVVNDPDVDAVYISLSNEAHLPWIIEALRSGKPVLCEKPLTLNLSQCQTAFREADERNGLLVEATWNRWHPRYRRADELIGRENHGPVRSVRAAFSFEGVPQGNYRLDASRGGGALLDLGPYLLAPLVDWCADDWTSVSGVSELNQLGADLTTRASLRSEQSVADLHASISEPELQTLDVAAEGLTVSWGPPAHTSWRTESTLTMNDGTNEWVERFDACDAYQLMVEDVSRAIRGEEVGFMPTARHSLAQAALIDRLTADVERAVEATERA